MYNVYVEGRFLASSPPGMSKRKLQQIMTELQREFGIRGGSIEIVLKGTTPTHPPRKTRTLASHYAKRIV